METTTEELVQFFALRITRCGVCCGLNSRKRMGHRRGLCPERAELSALIERKPFGRVTRQNSQTGELTLQWICLST